MQICNKQNILNWTSFSWLLIFDIKNLITGWESAKKLTDYWELGTPIQALLHPYMG